MDYTDRIFSDRTALLTTGISVSVMLVAIAVFLLFGNWHFSWVLDEQVIANFGDFIGGVVGTLLAFAAAVLYYVALKEQRKDVKNNQRSLSLQNQTLQQQIEEFRQQRFELEETRKVYERQTQLMSEQAMVMRRQQFESSFYSLLGVYTSCKSQLNSKEEDCFRTWIENISTKLPTEFKNKSIFERHNDIIRLYDDLYVEKRDVLSPYINTIYRILYMIDNTTMLDEEGKMLYVKIFRAQLSDYETLFLYYNYHSNFSKKSRNIAYKLNFLKNYDYLLSIDAKNVHDSLLTEDRELQLFLQEFDDFLKISINGFCEGFVEEYHSPQRAFSYQDLYSEISSTPDISIKLTLPIKSEKLSKEFCALLSDFVRDRLFLSQFSPKRESVTFLEMGEIDNRRVYECILHSPFVQKLMIDIDND